MIRQKTETLFEEKNKVKLPKFKEKNNNTSIELAKKWKNDRMITSKRKNQSTRYRKGDYTSKLTTYFKRKFTLEKNNGDSNYNISTFSQKSSNVYLKNPYFKEKEVQNLKLKKDKYFLSELQKCYFNLEGLCELTEFQFKFKKEFEEILKNFRNNTKFKPQNEEELSQKILEDEFLTDLEISSLKHKNKILILDLDETLIHARYVLDHKEGTFKLFLQPNGPEVNVKNLK